MPDISASSAARRGGGRRLSIHDVIFDYYASPKNTTKVSPTNHPTSSSKEFGISRSGRSEYGADLTPMERVKKAFNKFFREFVRSYEENPDAHLVNLEKELEDFVETERDLGLSLSEVDNLKNKIIAKILSDRREIDTFKVMKVFGKGRGG